MTRDDADRAISAGVPGSYRFELHQYSEAVQFLHEFRRYEGMCRARGYVFTPSVGTAVDPPFDAFDITIESSGLNLPFVAHSRMGMSRKLPRM